MMQQCQYGVNGTCCRPGQEIKRPFANGDKVVYIGTYCDHLVGKHGRIVAMNDYAALVEFDDGKVYYFTVCGMDGKCLHCLYEQLRHE